MHILAVALLAAVDTSTAAANASHLAVSGYVQADFQKLDRSSDQLDDGTALPLNEDAFTIRRARLQLSGQWMWLGIDVEADFTTLGGPQVGLRHVEGHAQWPPQDDKPLIYFGVGSFEVPFGYEVYGQGNLDRLFTERAKLSQAFVPGEFDVGARLAGQLGWLGWVIALQNGEPVGGAALPGVDPNAAKDVAARITAGTSLAWGLSLDGGFSTLIGRGFHEGTPPTKDSVVWRDFNEDGIVQQSELIAIRGAAGIGSENFDRWGVAADLQLRAPVPIIGELTIYGEIAFAVNLDRGVAPEDPVSLGRDQRSRGWYVAVTQELGRYAMAGVRVDRYEPNTDALDLQGGLTVLARRPFTTYTFTGAGRLEVAGARGRAIVEYSHEDNALGRDDAGRPAKLANDVFRARIEVSF